MFFNSLELVAAASTNITCNIFRLSHLLQTVMVMIHEVHKIAIIGK